MKIVSVVGGRPNFMKLASVCGNFSKKYEHLILHTGQHYDYQLSQKFFDEFSLPPPNANLNVGSLTGSKQVSKILTRCEDYFAYHKPKLVIVYGDMNSTLGAALASSKLKIPIAHVEAGIRSFDKTMPEEINRIITDHISTLLFTPTNVATTNLLTEGIKGGLVESGDTTYDLFLKVEKNLSEHYYKKLNLKKDNYFFATVHRPANTDMKNDLEDILGELIRLGKPVVFPMHPRTKKMAIKFGLKNLITNSNLIVKEPISYLESLSLQRYSQAILTDSGGIQKEAYFLKVPCITFRTSTEWPETVNTGWNTLWYTKGKALAEIIKNFKRPKSHPQFFGAGQAGDRIVKSIDESLENS